MPSAKTVAHRLLPISAGPESRTATASLVRCRCNEARHCAVVVPRRQRRLQRAEIGMTFGVQDRGLSVDDAVGQRAGDRDKAGEPPAPVVTFTRERFCFPALDPQLHAVSIELDLVNPLWPC